MPSKMAHRTIVRYKRQFHVSIANLFALELRELNRGSLRWFTHTILSIRLLKLSFLIRQNKRNLIKTKIKICLLRICIQWRAAGTTVPPLPFLIVISGDGAAAAGCALFPTLPKLYLIESFNKYCVICLLFFVPHVFRSLEMEMPTYGSSKKWHSFERKKSVIKHTCWVYGSFMWVNHHK